MPLYAADTLYALSQLGLDADTSLDSVTEILADTTADRFFAKVRGGRVQKYVDFLRARVLFGDLDQSFADLRKVYLKKAMALHPDRNKGDLASEEELKKVTAAYALLEAVHREALAAAPKNDKARASFKREAHTATAEEKGKEESPAPKPKQTPPHPPTPPPRRAARAVGSKKYLAASIPRSVRAARLSYLPRATIIGSHVTKREKDLNLIFDVIMLPEDQFLRARSWLSVPELVNAQLSRDSFAPPYVLQNVHEVIVPAGQADPEGFAAAHFKKIFRV